MEREDKKKVFLGQQKINCRCCCMWSDVESNLKHFKNYKLDIIAINVMVVVGILDKTHPSCLDVYYYYYYYSVCCLMTGPKPPPKRFLHIVRSKASSFKWEYPLLSLRSSSSFLRLLPRLLVTSISPFIFPSITCFRRQFLRKMWPIQLAFRFRISRRIFLCSLTQ